MSKDTERLNKMVQAAFFSLHQKPEITHGVVFNLYQGFDSTQVVFPICGQSGGLVRQLVFYLTAEHPTKGMAFTNAVSISFEDTYEVIEERMGREMARLQGFWAGKLDSDFGFIKTQHPQPRIANLDAGDLGIPWELSIERHEPHAGEYHTYGDIKRSEVPLLRTRAEPGVFDRKTLEAGRALIGEAWPRIQPVEDRSNPVPVPDRERGLPDPRKHARISDIHSPLVHQANEAVTHQPERTAGEEIMAAAANQVGPFPADQGIDIKPAPTCECGAEHLAAATDPRARWALDEVNRITSDRLLPRILAAGVDLEKETAIGKLGPPVPLVCECGAKDGELHFQFCPMWQDLLEVPRATQTE